ncbi:MAG TPA: hypothetical protein VFA20_19560 [Myxococcaceae bacterium]|nr:hypothetical protein [Myxococcaceae bacterium]
MTQKKDLKRRVRERMAKTGERYAAALRQVKAKVESSPEPGLEADSYLLESPLRCQLMASRDVYRRVLADRGARLVARFAEVVNALEGDPAGVLFRRAVRGEPVELQRDVRVAMLNWRERVAERTRYARRLELGLRGVSADGCILAFDHDGQPLVASLSVFPRWTTVSLETAAEFLETREAVELFRGLILPRVG